jgi:F-type H+-transporting ATPase subunit delta
MAVAHRVYARALFEASEENGVLDRAREDLGLFVAALDEVPELDTLLRNPQIDPRAKADTVDALVGGTDELLQNFLRLVIEKNRGGELREIQREFERLVAERERRLTVELTTAYQLSDEEAQEITEQIARASGRPVDATRNVDESLIGGFVLKAGTMRVDASVRGRLERLRRELTSTVR